MSRTKITIKVQETAEVAAEPFDPEKDFREGRSPFTIPRAQWGPGPWDGEPDRDQFWENGHPCICLRGPFGAWNGYVGIERGPLVGSDGEEFSVHGGVTYNGPSSTNEDQSYYHVNWQPGWPGVPDPAALPVPWWIGFDCNHAWDIAPALVATMRLVGLTHDTSQEVYRTLEYCREQVRALAQQIETYEKEQIIP